MEDRPASRNEERLPERVLPQVGLDDWAEALLSALLPVQTDGAPHPVLLACDEEVLRVAGPLIGVQPQACVETLATVIRRTYAVAARQLDGLIDDGAAFRRAVRPRPTPRFLPILAFFVFAASRMAPEAEHSTHAYYPILRTLLQLPGSGEADGFYYVPVLFDLLQEWLSLDEQGRRGELLLPASPNPKWVGYPISQTVFRERDRQVLSRFFDERLQSLVPGIDVLRLLRGWSRRHELTSQARSILFDETLAARVRAAIESARQAWDGTVVESNGKRIWPGRLSLDVSNSRLLASSSNTTTLMLVLDRKEVALYAGGAIQIPWESLSQMTDRPLTIDVAGGREALRVPQVGNTLLFAVEQDEWGSTALWQVRAVETDEVWLLTHDPALPGPLREFLDSRVALPMGWTLLGNVPIDRLPTWMDRGRQADARLASLALEGGLLIEPNTYLGAYAPDLIVGDLDSQDGVNLVIDGNSLGPLLSGQRSHLPSDVGWHHVIAGDGLFERRYEIVDRSPTRPSYGELCHDLDHGERVLQGLMSAPIHASRMLAGAVLIPPAPVAIPVLYQRPHAVFVIRSDGTVSRHDPPPRPEWLAPLSHVYGSRWEIPSDGVAWVVCPDFPASAFRWSADAPTRLDPSAAAIIAQIGATPAITDRRHDAVAAQASWESLYATTQQGLTS